MHRHDVQSVERFGAIGAFSHPVGKAIFDAVITEKVTTSLQGCILEILAADST